MTGIPISEELATVEGEIQRLIARRNEIRTAMERGDWTALQRPKREALRHELSDVESRLNRAMDRRGMLKADLAKTTRWPGSRR